MRCFIFGVDAFEDLVDGYNRTRRSRCELCVFSNAGMMAVWHDVGWAKYVLKYSVMYRD